MADFPRTLSDSVAIGGDSVALSVGTTRTAVDTAPVGTDDPVRRTALKRRLYEVPGWSDSYEGWATTRLDDFSGNLSAYTLIDGLSISGGELVGTLGAWSDMYLETGYVAGMPALIEFDFWVPAYSGPSDTYYAYEADADGRYIYVDSQGILGEPVWGLWLPGESYVFTPTPSTWYRVKTYFAGRYAGAPVAAKVWPRNDPEPDEWQHRTATTSQSSAYNNNYFAIEASGTGAVEQGRMDNVRISSGGLPDSAGNPYLAFRSYRRFDLGGAGTVRTERTLFIEGPAVSVLTLRRFDIEGRIGVLSERVLTLDGALKVDTRRVFDIETESTEIAPEADVGAPVNPTSVASTSLTAPASAGDTTITVTSTSGMTAGTLMSVGDDVLAIASVDSPTSLTLAAPLSAAVASGGSVSTAFGFVPGIHVFTKAGVPIGVLTGYNITTAPTKMIGSMGSVGFYVPVTNPKASLIQSDRLIAFQFRQGSGALWAGTIEVDDSASSVITVMAPDVLALLTGNPVSVEDSPAAPYAAAGAYRKIMDVVNAQKIRDGEITWKVSATAATNLFYGELNLDGDPLDGLDDVARRSDTEYMWEAAIGSNGRLALTLVASNEFRVVSAHTIFDGPGGNVASQPRWVRDAAPIRNGLRLRGIASEIGKFLPDWAQWAVEDVSPEAEVYVNPGDYRRRVDDTINVDFGLSPTVMKNIADQILELLWGMYRQFLYAWHDTYGKPYHEGWGYEGPPSRVEPFLHTMFGWRTRLRLVEIAGQPASVVMFSERERQVLGVTYNRVTGTYRARRYWANEQEGVLYIVRVYLHGRVNQFLSSGGVLIEKNIRSFDHSRTTVSPYPVTMRYDYVDEEGKARTSWHTVRRVTSLVNEITDGEGIPEDWWLEMKKPTGPTDTPFYTRPTVGDPPYMYLQVEPWTSPITFDSAFITKMYEAERGRIRDWDPRRDGVGVYMRKRTVYNNAPTTRERWNLVPFGVGVEGTTSLTTGIAAGATTIYVDSVFSLPRLGADWDGSIAVGLDPVEEIMVVTKIVGNALTVKRGQQGSAAIIHEDGTSVRALNAQQSSVFEHLWKNLDWTEGRAWAQRLLTKLSKPFIRVSLDVNNRNGTWAKVSLGNVHPINLSTEGVNGLVGTARVIGIGPDALTGRMEVVLEWQT